MDGVADMYRGGGGWYGCGWGIKDIFWNGRGAYVQSIGVDKFRNGEGTIIITNYENKYFSDSTKIVVESYSSRGSENVFSGVRCKKSVKDHCLGWFERLQSTTFPKTEISN